MKNSQSCIFCTRFILFPCCKIFSGLLNSYLLFPLPHIFYSPPPHLSRISQAEYIPLKIAVSYEDLCIRVPLGGAYTKNCSPSILLVFYQLHLAYGPYICILCSVNGHWVLKKIHNFYHIFTWQLINQYKSDNLVLNRWI